MHRRGARRLRLAGLLLAPAVLVPALASCGNDRPPKPRCAAGYQARWDSHDHEWDCERSSSGSSHGTGHRTRGRTRH
ncbi:conserved exported hypothetical protein [Frankia canadensis]|uniref:Lipoprotein n=1 Tax=Frankia canadensis TaxID=1836972 RepID=A0A2I2KL88_9ACTN|nr:hypothetical protein [Frankia canadensis]SNQ46423.1 conserved exported hypothetical protein [Frankia canadensis]SOU53713.1 conserved exported hypothetical protein [Frankia canadensis]